ncbi:MAG: ribosome biogenesis GTPase Der [Patescibacteria group bacterium]
MNSKSKMPTVVLVGRTNVGKSTLFNRLTEKREAMVSRTPGTTRDRREGLCSWRGKTIKIIDTGGLDVDFSDFIESNIAKQAHVAIKQADIVLFVVDLKSDPLPQDIELARALTKLNKTIITVGNKAETKSVANRATKEKWKLLDMPYPFPVSAIQGVGVGDLLDIIYDKLGEDRLNDFNEQNEKPCRVAVIGKPNVGKSSILNSILGEERFITSPISHTTREPNDILIEAGGKKYILIDTAGIRKKNKINKTKGLEAIGVERTKKILTNTDVALLVVDSSMSFGTQERVLAGMLEKTNVGIIVIANKWDLVGDKDTNTMNQYRKYIEGTLPFLKWAPVMFVSAKTGKRIDTIFHQVDIVQESRARKVDKEKLDAFLKEAMKRHSPMRGKGPKPPKVTGIKQTGTFPPTFELYIHARREDTLHPSYVRYLENQMRNYFDFTGSPINIKIVTDK